MDFGTNKSPKSFAHHPTRTHQTVFVACSALVTSATERSKATVASIVGKLKEHYSNLLDAGTKGEVNLEMELKRLDAASDTLTAKHKDVLFPLVGNSNIRRLFQDFRFLSEDLHQTLVKLFDLGAVLMWATRSLRLLRNDSDCGQAVGTLLAKVRPSR